MAVKIRLKRMGKIRAPFYRVVVMDSRAKRDGRAIEEIGKYHPTEEPSLIDIDSERALHWLGRGAQPTEAVAALLKVTGDWQKYKGTDGTEGTLRVKAPKTSKKELYEAAMAATGSSLDAKDGATTPKKRATKAAAKTEVPAQAETAKSETAKAETAKSETAKTEDAPVAEAKVEDAPVAEAKVEDAPVAEAKVEDAPVAEATVEDAPAADTASDDTASDDTASDDTAGGILTMLEEALEHLVKGIVDHTDEVVVRRKELRQGELLEVRVHPEDLGRVIGRSGRTASALRTVVGALAGGSTVRVDIVDTDRVR